MHTIDLVILIAYFAVVFGIGVYFFQRAKTSKSYFLADRSVGWVAVGASLFASNISSEHFIGLAGSGASSGLAVGSFEWLAVFMAMILAWVFVPFYLRSGVYTMPEFLERRYGPACRWYLTTVSVLAYVVTKISVSLYAGALVLQAVLGWDFYHVGDGDGRDDGDVHGVWRTGGGHLHGVDAGGGPAAWRGRADPHWPRARLVGWPDLRAALPPDYFHMIKPSSDRGVPVDRHFLRRAHPWNLVLVHRSNDRAARARSEERSAGARRRAALRPAEDPASLRSRAARTHRQGALSRHRRGRGLPDARHPAATDGARRVHGGGIDGGADVVARRDVQLGVDARDIRRLQEAQAGRHGKAARRRRTDCDGRDGRPSACCGSRSSST